MLRGVYRICCLSLCLLCCLPGAGLALDWAVLGPLPSSAPDALAPAARDWMRGAPDRPVAGPDGALRWTVPHPDPVDLRAIAQAPPGGTLYARAVFESAHAGPLAVRVRCDSAFRVWLDGRLIGGRARAVPWTAAPVALPVAVDAGTHRLLVEVRPPHDRSAVLAATLTTPQGAPIAWQRTADAPIRPAIDLTAPIALRRVPLPPTTLPAQRWQPIQPAPPPLALPELPADWQTMPRWPDAGWEILADALTWRLDTRQAARRLALRVHDPAALPAVRRFAARFDHLRVAGISIPPDAIEVGVPVVAESLTALPPDPLALGAARLTPAPAPVWRWSLVIDAPRRWTVSRAARGVGGARQTDGTPGRRQWRYTAEALAPGAAALRVSRAADLDGFVTLARLAVGDRLRPGPEDPPCDPAQTGLDAALACARTGAPLRFGQSTARPPLAGPVDLADFDWIGTGTPPPRVAWAIALDGTRVTGPGVAQLRYTLTPQAPALPAIPIGGPCGSAPSAPTGQIEAQITTALVGLPQAVPPSRTERAHGMRLTRQFERTSTGWQARYQLRWTDQARVTPARRAATCARWGLR